MPLPPPAPRTENHRRSVVYESFLREDGLWDIDATVRDAKLFDYEDLERGLLGDRFLHDISARVTFDAGMIVREAAHGMNAIPYAFCAGGGDNLGALVGASLARGWRKRVAEALGATRGCTHLREMLGGVPTVAFQTLSAWAEHGRPKREATAGLTERPFYLGACHALALDGPVVETWFPRFAEPSRDED